MLLERSCLPPVVNRGKLILEMICALSGKSVFATALNYYFITAHFTEGFHCFGWNFRVHITNTLCSSSLQCCAIKQILPLIKTLLKLAYF
jgi:hypothetical protein